MFKQYWELGFSVLPVLGKRTIVPEWSKWCIERQPEELIDRWEKYYKYPTYGIAICCGPESNIDALDIDSNSRDILDLCPRSPIERFGSRGSMRIFRHNPKIIKLERDRDNLFKTDPKPREGIQILSTGNYFVIPPSIHPDTKRPYEWIGPYNLENLTILDLDQISNNEIENIIVYISRFPLTNKDGSNSISGIGGRNDKLTIMCYAKIINHPEKSDEEIAEELLLYDNQKHFHPYFSDQGEMYFRKSATPFGRAMIFVKGSRDRIRKKGHL